MGWKKHVIKLAILGRIPFGSSLRRVKRRLFGYSPELGNIRSTLSDFDDMCNAVERAGRSFVGATVLEIGSGWFPVIPIMLSASGAERIIMSDLTPHMDRTTFAASLDFLKSHFREVLGPVENASMEDFRFEYNAPFRADSITDGSIDFIISRTVLEHISVVELKNLLVQLRPKLALNGLMVHCIDHSDHLEHKDRSISKINFLTWSDRRHRFINWLTKAGENRLRHHEYRKLFVESGYKIIFESGQAHPDTVECAKKLPLQDHFSQMTPEEVSILSSVYVLSPRVVSQ